MAVRWRVVGGLFVRMRQRARARALIVDFALFLFFKQQGFSMTYCIMRHDGTNRGPCILHQGPVCTRPRYKALAVQVNYQPLALSASSYIAICCGLSTFPAIARAISPPPPLEPPPPVQPGPSELPPVPALSSSVPSATVLGRLTGLRRFGATVGCDPGCDPGRGN